MADVLRMPKFNDETTKGVVVAWHMKVGDVVRKGDALIDIETDKATIEIESHVNGVLLEIKAAVGETVLVDAELAVIGELKNKNELNPELIIESFKCSNCGANLSIKTPTCSYCSSENIIRIK